MVKSGRLSCRSSGFKSCWTQRFSPWNYFTGGSGNLVASELASGSGSGLYTVVVDARLSGTKRGKSVVTGPFLTASLLGRALTRILKTGVQDSHLAKSRSPNGKSGVPLKKSWSPTNLCMPYILSILAGSDTFE